MRGCEEILCHLNYAKHGCELRKNKGSACNGACTVILYYQAAH